MDAKTIARFFSYISVPSDPNSCWEWQGVILNTGYGQFYHHAKSPTAHRFMAFLVHGEQPSSVHVCHTCDNRRCVNPSHLFLGDASINQRDCAAKGRRPKGVHHKQAKLTDDQVRLIRSEPRTHGYQARLAKRLGVSNALISKVVLGKGWAHVT